MVIRDECPDIVPQHLLFRITQGPRDLGTNGQEPASHIVRTDQRLTVIEQVPVSFLTTLYLFFEFLTLSDLHRINDHPLYFSMVIQHLVYFAHIMLQDPIFIAPLLLPFEYLPRTQYFFTDLPPCPGNHCRPAQMLAKFLI